MKQPTSPVTVLVILDGFGYSKEKKYNAIYHAKTIYYDSWMHEYPHAILEASGAAVGLPHGAMGNSEAGHLTIGAGRIIKQPVTLITDAIDNGAFAKNPILINALKHISSHHTLHIMGLLSDGEVHATMKQLFAFLDVAHAHGIKHIVVHPFLDGRDVPPQSASTYLEELEKKLASIGGTLGSLHGRFYAMDRDTNWDRTERTYRALTESLPRHQFKRWADIINHYYEKKITDEFIPPTQLDPSASIKNGDGVIFFNFRPDRARQLTASFVDPTFKEFKTKPLKLACFITPTAYEASLKTDTLFPQPYLTHTLKEILVAHDKTIFSIAETEKYAHVTYFFNGGKEASLSKETRLLIPSKKDKNYKDDPAMAAGEITKAVIKSLREKPCDFYLINYANADMVGHTGDFSAAIAAIEYMDKQLGELYKYVIGTMNGTLYITADHGNAEVMYDEKAHQPKTSHTTNLVPFIMIRKDLKGDGKEKLPLTQLADVAPFILKNMGLPIPKEMER